MDGKTYNRTQKVLDTLNELSATQAKKARKKEEFSRAEMLRLFEQLHRSLEEMFWADDFKTKENDK